MTISASFTCRLEIRGLVQGVGYRWSMVGEARRLSLAGWVRNRRDGSVEALVRGPRDRVDRLIAWARIGPRGALVDVVDVVEVDDAGGSSTFEQRPTA